MTLNTTTGVFTLTANKTYRLFGSVGFVGFSSATGWFVYQWVDATTNTALDTSGISVAVAEALNRDVSEFNATSANLIYRPSTNQTIKLRITDGNGTVSIRSGIGTKATIEQINPTVTVNDGSSGTSGTSGSSGTNGSSGSGGTSGTSGTGVSASYVRGSRSAAQTTGLTANASVIFTQVDNSTGSDISLNTTTGQITLAANRTYRLMAQIPTLTNSGAGARPSFSWYNETISGWTGSLSGIYAPADASNAWATSAGMSEAVITTTGTTVVSYRIVAAGSLNSLGNNTDFSATGSYPWFDIQVISGMVPLMNGTSGTSGTSGSNGSSGTSGTSGTSVLTTVTGTTSTGDLNVGGNQTVTGSTTLRGSLNVGVGSGNEGGEIDLAFAQNTTLTGSIVVFDVYSDKVRIFEGGGNNRGVSIDLSKAPAGVGGELLWKASGLVNAGTFVSLDNIKASITTSGNRGLSLAAVSTTFTADISGYYGYTAGGSGASTYNASITTSATTSIFNWGFNTQGDGSTYTVFDKTNNRVYRITIMINNSFNSNFISIERLY